MIEFLSQNILWWHYIITGFMMLILEIVTGTFLLLGLGVAMIIVGILDHYLLLDFPSQLLLGIILFVGYFILWKQMVKNKSVSTIGQSNHNLDTIGTVIDAIEPHKRGKVTFDTPLLGNSTWSATSKQKIEKNTRVSIVQVKGQLIEVVKI